MASDESFFPREYFNYYGIEERVIRGHLISLLYALWRPVILKIP
jgi:hypothetical protein